MQPIPDQTFFIVEHMQPYLFEWCYHQYNSMTQFLDNNPFGLIITNCQSFYEYEGKDLQDNLKYVKLLEERFALNPSKYRLEKQSVIELLQTLGQNVCMLDIRAQQQLSPGEKWNYLIFGGILGDHPPRDRPAPVRKHFSKIRHLGNLQLATDTAVLVSRLILAQKIPLEKIPMKKEPTIKGKNKNGESTTVQMEGFSYVSKEIDIKDGTFPQDLSKKQKKEIYMSEGVKNLLLKDDLEPQFIM